MKTQQVSFTSKSDGLNRQTAKTLAHLEQPGFAAKRDRSGQNFDRRDFTNLIVRVILLFAALFVTLSIAPIQSLALAGTKTPNDLTNAEVYHFKIGDFAAAIVSDGLLRLPPLPTYAPTADSMEVERALAERFLPVDELSLYGNGLYIDTGRHKVLVDTGAGTELGPTLGRLATNLQAAGIQPQDIDTVILTHAHPDHVGGIVAPDGELTFANARYYIAEPEWSFWSAPEVNLAALKIDNGFKQAIAAVAHKQLGAIADRVTLFQPDQEIVPGIKAIAAPGHTPGQAALLITSGNTQLIHAADVFFNEAFDLEHPDWQTGFDLDPTQAAATRRQFLQQVAGTQTLVVAYHMPFPAVGHIRARGDRYEWEPTLWQFEP